VISLAKDKTICPVHALKLLLKQARITSGPVFRRVDRYGFASRRRGLDPASVAHIVKQAARRASGMKVRYVSGHSFRAGHVSQAVRNGAPEYVVMK
jgi:integrase